MGFEGIGIAWSTRYNTYSIYIFHIYVRFDVTVWYDNVCVKKIRTCCAIGCVQCVEGVRCDTTLVLLPWFSLIPRPVSVTAMRIGKEWSPALLVEVSLPNVNLTVFHVGEFKYLEHLDLSSNRISNIRGTGMGRVYERCMHVLRMYTWSVLSLLLLLSVGGSAHSCFSVCAVCEIAMYYGACLVSVFFTFCCVLLPSLLWIIELLWKLFFSLRCIV